MIESIKNKIKKKPSELTYADMITQRANNKKELTRVASLVGFAVALMCGLSIWVLISL